MLKGIFSGAESTPPGLEKRKIPFYAEGIENDPAQGWITTQVFTYKKDRNERVYYAARMEAHRWKIYKYFYDVDGVQSFPLQEDCINVRDMAAAVARIADIEHRCKSNPSYCALPHLPGNLAEAAYLAGGYIDEKGDFRQVGKNEVLSGSIVLSRKGVAAIYNQSAEKAPEPEIKTWDDYYSKVVRKHPAGALAGAQLPEWFVKSSREMIKDTGALVPTIRDPQATLYDKLLARNRAYCCGIKIDGLPEAQYAFHVAQLTALMRAGSEVFRQLAASVSKTEENMELLKEIGDTIRYFVTLCHEKDFGFSREKAGQLVNIMMTGPDPYAGELLPLEEILGRHVPAPKPDPKQPGLD